MADLPIQNELVRRWTDPTTPTMREGNRVDYLVDGRDAFNAMLEAIQTTFSKDGSAYYIYLLAWYLDSDLPLKEGDNDTTIAKLFAKAASTDYGVEVRVMLYRNHLVPNTHLLQAHRLNQLRSGAAIVDSNTLSFYQSHHQKVLVVRGSRGLIGFCGGIDISADRLRTVAVHKGSPFHDVHCRIEGLAANDLLNVFVQRWSAHPDSKKDGKLGQELRGAKEANVSALSKPKAVGDKFVLIARTFNSAQGKCANELSIRTTLLRAISSVRYFVYIEDQYLVNLEAAEALKARLATLETLQHLTILVPHPSITDLPGGEAARAKFIRMLVDGDSATSKKVRVFYRTTPGTDQLGPHSYVHAKTWIFDDELAVIGSANCNRRGWLYDSEVAAAICDRVPSPSAPSFARQLRIRLWSEHLGVDAGRLTNGVESADLWLKLTAKASVRPYVLPKQRKAMVHSEFPAFSTDPRDRGMDSEGDLAPSQADWDTKWDPIPKQLPACPSSKK